MTIMKILGYLLLGLLAAFSLAIGLVFYLTRGMTDAADAFLGAWNAGQPHASYVHLSPEFTRAVSEAQLHKAMQQMGLTNVISTSWNNRSTKNNVGTITGTVTRVDQSTANLEITLIKVGDLWKILNLKMLPVGIQPNSNPQLANSTTRSAIAPDVPGDPIMLGVQAAAY